jgi:hypothetical protein
MLDYHKVPLTVFLVLFITVAIAPRFLLLWGATMLLAALAEWLCPKLPSSIQNKIRQRLPEGIEENRWFTELRSGITQIRPFLITAIYFCCAPIALVWMFCHWLKKLLPGQQKKQSSAMNASDDCIVFLQRKEITSKDEDSNFFHSPAFATTAIGLFACGLPAALTYMLYKYWGIDAILGHPSLDPQFHKIVVVIGFYFMSLSWCLMAFFIRAWFTFPLNFMGNEDEYHVDKNGVRRKSENWFSRVLAGNCVAQSPDYLSWQDIRQLKYESPMRLHPLPTKLFDANSIEYKALNKLAAIYDTFIDHVGREERISISTKGQGTFAQNLTLSLASMTGDERAKLFYATRKWAPHVVIDEKTQEKLLGSAVLREPQYTQVWFDLLTSKTATRKRQSSLQAGEILNDGEFEIVERIASGGQATAYLAEKKSTSNQNTGAKEPQYVVLKEFILSSSDAVGALLESAREFESEASLLSVLDHPHIVKRLDFFSEDRRAYLVLEHLEGTSLRKLVQEKGPLDKEQVIELASQMCDVLQYLHSQTPSIVHRDFSPDNLIVHPTKGIMLIDFSLSGSQSGKVKRTVVGKHSYTPPEQFREQACPQSDIYALGATIYFMLTGRDPKPISCSNPQTIDESISPELSRIVQKATTIDLEHRYPEASWLKLDLEALLSGSPGILPVLESSE